MKIKGILVLLLILVSNLCNAQIQQTHLSFGDLIVSMTKFGSVMYLTTEKKVFYKDDLTPEWQQYANWSGIKYLNGNSNSLYAIFNFAGSNSVKYTQSDLAHFVEMNNGLLKFAPTCIASTDSIIYAGSKGEGLIYYRFSEKKWVQTSLVACNVKKIVLNNNKVFALTSKGLFYSNAEAQVWKKIIVGNADNIISDVIVDSSNVYCTSIQGVYFYNIVDETISNINSNLVNINCSSLTLLNSRLIVATRGNGLFYSNTNQISWQAVSDDRLKDDIYMFYNVDSTIYLASTISGLFKSTDDGENWSTDGTNIIEEVNIKAIGSIDSNIVFGEHPDKGVWKTDLNLLNWSNNLDIKTTLSYDYLKEIVAVDTVFFCLLDYGKLYRSFDKGSTWENITTPNQNVYNLSVTQNTLYICTKVGIYMTTDFGANWQQFSNITQPVYSFAKFGSIAYYLDNNYPRKLYRSQDGGSTWAESSLTDLLDINLNSKYAFAVTSNGLYRSSILVDNWTKYLDCPNYAKVKLFDKNVIFNIANAIYASKDYGYTFSKISLSGLASNDKINDFTIAKGNIFIGCSYSFWSGSLGNYVGVDDDQHVAQINSFELLQNYPNPFNPSTTIKFEVPQQSNVKLIVYDILGKVVETLVDEEMVAGTHSINWTPNNNGKNLSSGIYFCKLNVNSQIKTIKMLYLK